MNKAVFDCNSYVKHLHFLDLVHAAQALLIAGAQTTNDNTGLWHGCLVHFVNNARQLQVLICYDSRKNYL